MKKSNKLIYILLGLFLVLAAYAIFKGSTKQKGEIVTVTQPEKRTIRETVSASGKIYPETEVKISSDVSGEIVELYVKEGDSVRVGQVLAKIDPEAYLSSVERGEASLNSSRAQLAISQAQVETNKAQKEQITAQLENARTIHNRNVQLKEEGVISQAEFDQSLASVKQLEANLRAAEASIRSAQQNAKASEFSINAASASLKELKTSLNRTTIKAPTDGIVSSLSVERGERVVGTIQMTGTEMMRISNLDLMEVQVEVSENDIVKVALGDETDIDVDAYVGKKFKGTVTHIANSAANITQTGITASTDQVTNFIVKIRVDEKSYREMVTENNRFPLRPGMSASVDIYTNQNENVVTVPIQCVTIREKKDSNDKSNSEKDVTSKDIEEVVFILEADTVRMAKVETGIQDDEFIVVKSGVNIEDKVVTGPYNTISKVLKSGDKVSIKPEKKAKK